MGLMDKMMDRMIVNLSVAEKEDLMLQMMPLMMERIDPLTVTPAVLKEVGSSITLTGIYRVLRQALNDEDIRKELGELVEALTAKLPELAHTMRSMTPAMMSLMKSSGFMDGMMNLMAKFMPVMMPMMREMMPVMMNERMPALMAQDRNVCELMPEMMVDIMPGCIEMIAPEIEPDARTAFFSELAEKIERVETVEASVGG